MPYSACSISAVSTTMGPLWGKTSASGELVRVLLANGVAAVRPPVPHQLIEVRHWPADGDNVVDAVAEGGLHAATLAQVRLREGPPRRVFDTQRQDRLLCLLVDFAEVLQARVVQHP